MLTVLPLRSPNLVYGAQSIAAAEAPVDALLSSLSPPQAPRAMISPALMVPARTARVRGPAVCPNILLLWSCASAVRGRRRPKRYLGVSQDGDQEVAQ